MLVPVPAEVKIVEGYNILWIIVVYLVKNAKFTVFNAFIIKHVTNLHIDFTAVFFGNKIYFFLPRFSDADMLNQREKLSFPKITKSLLRSGSWYSKIFIVDAVLSVVYLKWFLLLITGRMKNRNEINHEEDYV